MGKYVMVVQSNAKPGREGDYESWYETVHLPQICAIPGVTSGRRFRATPVGTGVPGLPYLALYEVETDDPAALLGELGQRSQDGRMTHSDSLDIEASVLWIYEQI